MQKYEQPTPTSPGWFIQTPDAVLSAPDNTALQGRFLAFTPTVPDNIVFLTVFPVRTSEVVYRESYVVRRGARAPPEMALCA